MCAEWKFPEPIAAGISSHHDDEEDGGLPSVSLVGCMLEVDEGKGLERLIETTHDRFGLAPDRTAGLVEASLESADEIARLFT